MKKRVLCLFLVLVMVVTLLPISASADESVLFVGNSIVTAGSLSGPGWNYDPSTHTLYLTNANINSYKATNNAVYGIVSTGDLNIVLSGSNTIDISGARGGVAVVGIYVHGKLCITGDGSLTVKTAMSSDTSRNESNSSGIFCSDLDITDVGSIVIYGNTGFYVFGIYVSNSLKVVNSCITISTDSYGLYTNTGIQANNISIEDHSVITSDAGSAADMSCGIMSDTLSVLNSTVYAYAGTATFSEGIVSTTKATIYHGSNINAIGESEGFFAGILDIRGGKLFVSGKEYAIGSANINYKYYTEYGTYQVPIITASRNYNGILTEISNLSSSPYLYKTVKIEPSVSHTHEYSNFVTAPTCTARGYTTHTCSCGDTYKTNYTPALGHSYKSGVCERCGAKAAKPGTPTVTLSTVTSSGKIKVSWKAVSGAAKYEVYRSTDNKTFKKLGTTTSTSYTNTSATAGTKYYYKVRAVSAEGAVGSYSKAVSKVCDLAQPVVTLSNVASSGKIKVSWAKVTNASKYEVYRATSSSGTYKKLKTTTSTSYTDTSAKAGTKYYYKVKAICSKTSDGNSAYSAVKYLVCDLAKPTAKIALSSGHPKVTWAKIDGASKYEVYRATSKSGTYTKLTTTSSASYTDKKAKAGKTYYYKVKAVCSKTTSGNSAYSSIVSIKAK